MTKRRANRPGADPLLTGIHRSQDDGSGQIAYELPPTVLGSRSNWKNGTAVRESISNPISKTDQKWIDGKMREAYDACIAGNIHGTLEPLLSVANYYKENGMRVRENELMETITPLFTVFINRKARIPAKGSADALERVAEFLRENGYASREEEFQ